MLAEEPDAIIAALAIKTGQFIVVGVQNKHKLNVAVSEAVRLLDGEQVISFGGFKERGLGGLGIDVVAEVGRGGVGGDGHRLHGRRVAENVVDLVEDAGAHAVVAGVLLGGGVGGAEGRRLQDPAANGFEARIADNVLAGGTRGATS